jgi:hypothetical protein
MKKVNCIAAVMGMGLAMTSWAALAQGPAVRQDPVATTVSTAASPAIPADQQPTPEQLNAALNPDPSGLLQTSILGNTSLLEN